jgi:hypothetical protein
MSLLKVRTIINIKFHKINDAEIISAKYNLRRPQKKNGYF